MVVAEGAVADAEDEADPVEVADVRAEDAQAEAVIHKAPLNAIHREEAPLTTVAAVQIVLVQFAQVPIALVQIALVQIALVQIVQGIAAVVVDDRSGSLRRASVHGCPR